jgi:hypothetical protein
MDIYKIKSGWNFAIYGVVKNGECSVRNFIDSLEPTSKKQIVSLLSMVVENGRPPRNDQKFRHIGDKIYELKTRSGIRILCFHGDRLLKNSLILTHGFPKPKKNQLNREKEKAITFLHAFNNEAINIVNK